MTIQEAIATIETLYPLDARYSQTKAIAELLLLEAIESTDFDWRNLPDEVLLAYANLCIEKEREEAEKFVRRNS